MPFIPKGFTMAVPVPHPPLCQEVYVMGCYTLANEDLAIVKLEPRVHSEDFASLASALRTFFMDVHEVHVPEVQPCPLGAAFVRFSSALERERFLGPVFRFGDYSMTVVKHDEADNARSFDLDREAWVMLLAFPEDLRCSSLVAKEVSGFGIMVDWFEIDNLARVIVKVYLNDDAKIPDSVKVNAGLPKKGRSWTSPCFILKRQGISEPRDEGFVIAGSLHPCPPQPPRWMGFAPPASSDATPTASPAGNPMNLDAGGPSRWQEHVAPIPMTLTWPLSMKGMMILIPSVPRSPLN